MDVRQLRYFSAVVEHASLTRAADKCAVAASAISHAVTALEAEVGTALFVRRPRGMEATAAGLRLHEHAVRILRAVQVAGDDLRSASADPTGEISIGMPFSVIRIVGTDIMRSVLDDLPGVRLVLTEALSGVAFANLLSGANDLALVFNPPPDERAVRVPLLEEELCCIGKPELVGDTDAPIGFDEILTLPLLLLQSGTLARALIDQTRLVGRLERRARLQLASIAATIGALEAGLGVTLVPKVLVTEQLARGELVARRIADRPARRTLQLVARADERPTFLAERMSAMMTELCHAAVHEGRWADATVLSPGD